MENKEIKNVIIYIDYENIYKTLLMKNKNLLRIGFFEKLEKMCRNENIRIVNTIAYCNFDIQDLCISHHQSKLQEYGVDTIHTSNRGKNYADLKITVDVLEELYNNGTIDGLIIVSNDKDMTPLLKSIKRLKQFVYLITAGDTFDKLLENFPDRHIHLSEIEKINAEIRLFDMYEEIYNNLNGYLTKRFNDYCTGIVTDIHLEMNYYIKDSFGHFNIMKYEFANLISEMVEDELIYIYNYVYTRGPRTSNCIGIITKDLKEQYITKGIISETEIIKNYDFKKLINNCYKEFYPRS